MFFFYQILFLIVILFSPLIILVRLLRNKEDKKRFLEKFSFPSKKRAKGNIIWFHGASVGEILSIIPLIKYYEKNKSIRQILITSSTLSSSKILKKFNFKKTVHQFYPIDHYIFVKKFLKHWRPNVAIFIESEIWPCMFKKIKKFNIPLILINARLTKKTYNNWMKIPIFSKTIFGKINIAYPQNLETKNFLKKLKLKKIQSLGNLKFIENKDENLNQTKINLKPNFKGKSVWVASSTHKEEELFCARAHLKLKKKIKNLITIIIPRHIHRVGDIIKDINNLNLKVVLHSSKNINLKNTDIYIVDSFGETKKFHKISSTVFLGGSIIKRGGQNPLEAARFGARILHGPNTDNFKDIYKLLKLYKISKKIHTYENLASSIIFKKNRILGKKIKKIGDKILKKNLDELRRII